MSGNGGIVRQAARLVRSCGTLGIRPTLQMRREDSRIREEQYRPELLSGRERKAQQRKRFPREICFDVYFLRDGKTAEPEENTLRSLREQTRGTVRVEPDLSEIAPEDCIVFMEPDAYLHPGTLFECMKAVFAQGADLLYTDEDYYLETPKDLLAPYYKPDYGPDSLRGCNYAGPFLVCRASLLKAAGAGNFAELSAEERWDATLRLAAAAECVVHIPGTMYYRKTASAEKIPEPAVRRVKETVQGEPLVSILIPNRDHRDDLKRCVDSILAKTSYSRFEIIIIENNSTEEDTFRYYGELEKDARIRVIRREGAFNYSAVNNLGFREAKGEQILLLNNDTEVLSPDWLQEMLMYTQREDVGAAGAKLLYPDGTIQHAGIGIGILLVAGHWHRGLPGDRAGYYGRLRYAQDVSAVTGACMMIPRRVYEAVGGLDETFPVMFNDLDLCLKIRQAGYLIVWTPFAELTHFESRSRGPDVVTRKKKRFFFRETDRFLRRWRRVIAEGDPYYNPYLTRDREDFSLRGGNVLPHRRPEDVKCLEKTEEEQ